MAKSTFTGRLTGAGGTRLKLVLARKSGAPQTLATTSAAADGGFVFELESAAASEAVSAARAGEASLRIEGKGLRVELPSPPSQGRSRAASRTVDFGEVGAAAAPPGRAAKALGGAAAPASLVGVGGLGGVITPLDTNQMLLDLRNQVSTRDAQVKQLQLDLGAREAQLNQFRLDLNGRDTQLTQLRSELSSRDAQLNQLRAQLATSEPTLASLRSQVAALTSARDQALVDRAALTKQLSERTGALTEAQSLLKATQARIDTLSADFARSQTELATRDARVRVLEEELNAPGRPVPLDSVLDGLGSQVATSASKINGRGGWNLSDVRVQLKMMVTDGGTKVHFPKPGETPASGEVSAVDFVLRPTPTKTNVTPEVTVPSVVGYSPVVAERKLRALGLAVTTSYQTVKEVAGAPKRAGRVMTQRPAAGSRVAPAAAIELLIGKT